jgi:hypothetical protein
VCGGRSVGSSDNSFDLVIKWLWWSQYSWSEICPRSADFALDRAVRSVGMFMFRESGVLRFFFLPFGLTCGRWLAFGLRSRIAEFASV